MSVLETAKESQARTELERVGVNERWSRERGEKREIHRVELQQRS